MNAAEQGEKKESPLPLFRTTALFFDLRTIFEVVDAELLPYRSRKGRP